VGVAEPQLLHRAGATVLDQHVEGRHQASDDLARPGRLQVERQALLVAVEREERDALAVEEVRPLLAVLVALAGTLDFDDFSSEVAEEHRAVGPRHVLREVEHPQAGQRTSHEAGWSFCTSSISTPLPARGWRNAVSPSAPGRGSWSISSTPRSLSSARAARMSSTSKQMWWSPSPRRPTKRATVLSGRRGSSSSSWLPPADRKPMRSPDSSIVQVSAASSPNCSYTAVASSILRTASATWSSFAFMLVLRRDLPLDIIGC